MAEAFTWGPGGQAETSSSASRRRLAEALMQQGTATTPIQSPWQGIARVAQALMGGYDLRQEDERDRRQEQQTSELMASHPAFAGMAPAAAAPALAAASPGVAKVAAAVMGGGLPSDQAAYPQPVEPAAAPVTFRPGIAAPAMVQPGGDAAAAIAGIESGGAYDKLGPVTRTGDRAYGKYQVMGANVPQWTRAHLGQEMTPDQFLASPEAQDAVFKGQFGQYANKYGPEGAARAWFAGEGGMNNPNARDQLGTTVSAYADKFNRGYQPAAPAAAVDPAAIPPAAQPAQGYAVPGQPAPAAGPQMPPAVASWVRKAVLNPQTRAAAMGIMQQYTKPRETYGEEKDAEGNVWSINQQTGQRTVALKKDKAETPPQSVREYEYYKANQPAGQAPMPYDTWATAKARAAATNVTTNVGGGSDKQIFDEFVDRSKSARATAQGLVGIRNAREAIEGGAITGFRADNRAMLQKAGKYFGLTDAKDVENGEVFKAAIAPQVAAVLKATVGTANISDSDRRFAERAAGGSLDLEEGSIKRLLSIMERASVAQLQDHQEQLDAVYPDAEKHKRERALFGIRVPTGSAPPAGATKSGIKWSVE